ncbi:MAG: ribosome small subunit-dependent GTPase A, partial [Deltaproteobacteria bacterium]|nr:ribosome small subunit-dependent GTPase A [Deltaproteobacteria bacterium]
DLSEKLSSINERIDDVPVFTISNVTRKGFDSLYSILDRGTTFCLLGSSGAGKSTLLNNLAGRQLMDTKSISTSTKKGKHTTSHRELIVLENGGIVIDNPGMREIGIADTENGVESTFDEIVQYSSQCRFSDCTHTQEADCAVLEAVREGKIDRSLYENFLKLKRERTRFQSSIAEKRKKDKEFGKMVKEFKKIKKRES